MNKTVVTIKAAWRPYYLAQVLMGLSQCEGFKSYDYIVMIDKAPNEQAGEYLQRSQEVMIHGWAEIMNVAKMKAWTAPHPMGCAGNTMNIIAEAFHDYDRMIHLEDDTVPYGDYFKWMEWALDGVERGDWFAACPYNRRACRSCQPASTANPKVEDLPKGYTRPWFECGGGFGITRRVWDFIEEKGGMFGAQGNCNDPDLVGQAWKEAIQLGNGGSWAWPINQYFRERSKTDHLCIYPVVGRVQNIGSQEGRFNPSVEFYNEKIIDDTGLATNRELLSASKFTPSTMQYTLNHEMPYNEAGQ